MRLQAARDAPRPGTSGQQLQDRIAALQDIVNEGAARVQSTLGRATLAIVNLPVDWLQARFDDYFEPQFRVAGPRNPSGCFFRSYGQGGFTGARKWDGKWTDHRTEYCQTNLDQTRVPSGSGPGPWKTLNGMLVIGAQPRYAKSN